MSATTQRHPCKLFFFFLAKFVSDTEGSNSELLLTLNRNLVRSLESPEGLPNPSVHLGLRLSHHHNQTKETDHLNKLKNELHDDIQTYFSTFRNSTLTFYVKL